MKDAYSVSEFICGIQIPQRNIIFSWLFKILIFSVKFGSYKNGLHSQELWPTWCSSRLHHIIWRTNQKSVQGIYFTIFHSISHSISIPISPRFFLTIHSRCTKKLMYFFWVVLNAKNDNWKLNDYFVYLLTKWVYSKIALETPCQQQ